jgi:ankyrin repeat protein
MLSTEVKTHLNLSKARLNGSSAGEAGDLDEQDERRMNDTIDEDDWTRVLEVATSNHNMLVPKEDSNRIFLQCATQGDLDLMIDLVCRLGVNVDTQDYDETTALMYACSKGHLNVCQFLVEQGADLNISNDVG